MYTSSGDATLVVFCKRPAPHQGKRRLAHSLGSNWAHRLALTLLGCALEDAAQWPGPVVIAVSSAKDMAWASSLLSRDHRVVDQGVGNLGARLNVVDAQLRARQHQRLVYIGTDAPLLGEDHYGQVRAAFEEGHHAVLSHARDGGVTIMANASPWPDLAPLPWSTPRLGASLRQMCLAQGWGVEDITPSYDIDVAEDLTSLQQDLPRDERPARRHLLAELRALTAHLAKGQSLA